MSLKKNSRARSLSISFFGALRGWGFGTWGGEREEIAPCEISGPMGGGIWFGLIWFCIVGSYARCWMLADGICKHSEVFFHRSGAIQPKASFSFVVGKSE